MLDGDSPLLTRLIDEQIRVIRNLKALTHPEERAALDEVRAEAEAMTTTTFSAADISPLADAFVGKAIRKNYHPVTGRFVMIRKLGADLRKGKIHLEDGEVLPACHLSRLFSERHVLSDIAGKFGKREGRFSTSCSNIQGDGDYDDDANFCKFQAGLEKQ